MCSGDDVSLNGAIIIKKERGFTSHDVVAVVRKILHTSKVGHTGTLDPDAEGVLPVLIGKATRLSDYIMDGEKQYEADMMLGVTTTTGDASGEVVMRRQVSYDKVFNEIRSIADSFCGKITQIPPMYSAVKVGGKKLYELARAGEEVERKSRQVTISRIEILEMPSIQELETKKSVRIRCTCSKGTYIRTLIEDMGEALGCGAHTDALVRTVSGSFSINDAITLGDLRESVVDNRMKDIILPVDVLISRVFDGMQTVVASQYDEKALLNGNKLRWDVSWRTGEGYIPTNGDRIAVRSHKGCLIGLYGVMQDEDGFFIKPEKMLI